MTSYWHSIHGDSPESRIASATASLSHRASEANEFVRAFAQASREGKPTTHLEMSCLILGFTVESLKRIKLLSQQGVLPALYSHSAPTTNDT